MRGEREEVQGRLRVSRVKRRQILQARWLSQ
jgi:hypothetical protein